VTEPVALVTGGGTGIGLATARLLVAEGWRVTISGRRPDVLESAVEELGEATLAVAGDLTEPAGAERMVSQTVARFGRLDLLVNNAGNYHLSSVEAESEEDWRRAFDVNLHGPWRLCRIARPHLAASDQAAVINVLSTLAHRALAGAAAYCSSKAALDMLTRTLALEWAEDGIRVNSVSPGVVDTPIHEPGSAGPMNEAHPLGRIGRPEEVARAIVFLASPSSEWTTGANLDVDGGIRLT
jgi:2-deoxy-D-gluconate 3-dehydrogenase